MVRDTSRQKSAVGGVAGKTRYLAGTCGTRRYVHPRVIVLYLMLRRPPRSTLVPYPTLFRTGTAQAGRRGTSRYVRPKQVRGGTGGAQWRHGGGNKKA